ncbi:MAG: phosphoribosylamine--glycine ligase [Clostridiales Family XIII bacterium]|jgi:phosphoribosylamine--glycine ligase|nr:phosphoribosylamine--glycine ligase [Clostridiales Family XIII bacterium]
MNILIVGGGGREHAIALSLSSSKQNLKLFAAPGNPGISKLAECVDIKADDISKILSFAKDKGIEFAVIGPELPLSLGIVDELEKNDIKVFGPNEKCSQLEASKSFTKAFLKKYNIPTAKYKVFSDKKSIENNISSFGFPVVLKADGLAAGKGVIIAKNKNEALQGIDDLMNERKFGDAGKKILLEECLIGQEASLLCFVDGSAIIPMESAQDYKRIFDNDKGSNTGGMGTYSPSKLFYKNDALLEKIRRKILIPTFNGFKKEGLDFIGVLFVGLMLKGDDVRVIEFNNRFGDPEAQSVLPRLKTDLFEIMKAATENRLKDIDIKWSDKFTTTIVLAAKNYPATPEKGKVIRGLDFFSMKNFVNNTYIFHAGTDYDKNGDIVTNGGRVLGITAFGNSFDESRENAYKSVAEISFDGIQFRKDIGL